MISAAVPSSGKNRYKTRLTRSSARFDATGDQVIDTEVPREGQEVGVPRGQVVAEEIEDRRQREQRDEPICARTR